MLALLILQAKWATRHGQNVVVALHNHTECYQEIRTLKIIFQIDKIITNIIILQDTKAFKSGLSIITLSFLPVTEV